MKLYCWRAKTYDEEAFVIASSEQEARDALLKSIPEKPKQPLTKLPTYGGGGHLSKDEYALVEAWRDYEWKRHIVEQMLAGHDHELVVLEPGDVAWAEKS